MGKLEFAKCIWMKACGRNGVIILLSNVKMTSNQTIDLINYAGSTRTMVNTTGLEVTRYWFGSSNFIVINFLR